MYLLCQPLDSSTKKHHYSTLGCTCMRHKYSILIKETGGVREATVGGGQTPNGESTVPTPSGEKPG